MTTDIKLGLVVGLGVVIAVAVTYYSKGAPMPASRAGTVMPSRPAVLGRVGSGHLAEMPVRGTN